MASRRWFQQAAIVAGAPGARGLVVTPDAWRQAVRDLTAGAARLVSIWAESDAQCGHVVKAAFAAEPGLLVLSLQVPGTDDAYPGIEEFYPAAARMQRAIHDLHGLRSTDPDTRPWLRHASWPAGFLPLEPAPPSGTAVPTADSYAFVRVA